MSDSKSIQVFEFNGAKVRTAGTFEAPLFCAVDVCGALQIANVAQACGRLPPEQTVLAHHAAAENKPNYVSQGVKKSLYVTEAGLYRLVLRSNKPEAEAFVDWVTGEVLPAIRKYGSYSVQREQLLAECFPNLPSKSAPIFRELIASLLLIRREPGKSGNPPWARSLASSVYAWAIRVEGEQAARRAKNPKPSANRTDHSMFSEVADEAVKRVVHTGCDMARISFSWRDWKSKMQTAFGGRLVQGDLPFGKFEK